MHCRERGIFFGREPSGHVAMKRRPSSLCNVLVGLDRSYLGRPRSIHAGTLYYQQSGEGEEGMNIPLEYGVIIAGVVFGVFGLVVAKLDEHRLKRELSMEHDRTPGTGDGRARSLGCRDRGPCGLDAPPTLIGKEEAR